MVMITLCPLLLNPYITPIGQIGLWGCVFWLAFVGIKLTDQP